MFKDEFNVYCFSVLAEWPLYSVSADMETYCGDQYALNQPVAGAKKKPQRKGIKDLLGWLRRN